MGDCASLEQNTAQLLVMKPEMFLRRLNPKSPKNQAMAAFLETLQRQDCLSAIALGHPASAEGSAPPMTFKEIFEIIDQFSFLRVEQLFNVTT